MSGIRWTTGVGIAVGGLGGALAALMGAPASPAPTAPARATPVAKVAGSAVKPEAARAPASVAPPLPASPSPSTSADAPASATVSASAAPAPGAPSAAPAAESEGAPTATASNDAVAPVAPAAPALNAAPALDVPSTREGLLKAEMLCDRRKDFDACASAALALEQGTTGPADADQAKRFRRIALTHLVAQCEADSPHACFVLASKYRAGTELPAKPASADALEKRGLELCRLGRPAPECPAP